MFSCGLFGEESTGLWAPGRQSLWFIQPCIFDAQLIFFKVKPASKHTQVYLLLKQQQKNPPLTFLLLLATF